MYSPVWSWLRPSRDRSLVMMVRIFPFSHVRHHLLEAGAVEAAPGIAIIHIKAGVGEAVLPCVSLQDIPLVLDAVGLSVRPVILAETAVQGGDLILV